MLPLISNNYYKNGTPAPTMTTEKQPQMPCMKIINSCLRDKIESPLLNEEKGDEEMTKSALATFTAKEEEIERKKTEMGDKIRARLGLVEEETKRLVGIRGEVEAVSDPMRKEADSICKRIGLLTRDLKSMGIHCQKKEKEYKEAIESLNEKNKERGQLIAKLTELVTERDALSLKKLEEICKNI